MRPTLQIVLSVLILIICSIASVGIWQAIRRGAIFISLSRHRPPTWTYREQTPAAFWFCIVLVVAAALLGFTLGVMGVADGIKRMRHTMLTANHAPQRTRPSRSGCNPSVARAVSLSSCVVRRRYTS